MIGLIIGLVLLGVIGGLLLRQIEPERWRVEVEPSFDHASSLGRELLDDERVRRLKEGTVDAYLNKGRGGIFGQSSDKRGLSPIAVVSLAMERYSPFFARW